MKTNKKVLIVSFFVFLLIGLVIVPLQGQCFFKSKTQNKEVKPASCTPVGQLECPQGFSPDCPKQYKPSCVFVGTMQLPACLADGTDTTFYSYSLDKIKCQKK